MIIRCDRCSTVYELDEGLLAPDGSPVQCSRCANVFTARPARSPGQTLQGVPAADEAAPRPAPAAAAAPIPDAKPAARPAAARSAPAVYRPPAASAAQVPVTRAPSLRRDAVGTFESRLRRNARWRWLAPALALAAAAAAAGAFVALRAPADPAVAAGAARQEALARAAQDDAAGLAEARSRLEAVASGQPDAAAADLALIALLSAEPGRLGPPTGELSGAILQAHKALDALERAARAPGEVARARAFAAALEGNREEVRREATAARAHLGDDRWSALAELLVEARATDKAARERAAGALAVFGERHPELLRARYALALSLAASGKRTEAVAAAEAVLARNPRHERAAALLAELAKPPPQAPIAPLVRAVPPAEPPAPAPVEPEHLAAPVAAEKPAATPRKPAAQPADGAATSASTSPTSPAPRRSEAAADGTPSDGATESGADDAAASPRPARLRPAAVPPPEPILIKE